MNIDFAAVGGTAVTVAGATIFACEYRRNPAHPSFSYRISRWCHKGWCCHIPRAPQCRLRKCCPESNPPRRSKCFRTLATPGPQLPSIAPDRWSNPSNRSWYQRNKLPAYLDGLSHHSHRSRDFFGLRYTGVPPFFCTHGFEMLMALLCPDLPVRFQVRHHHRCYNGRLHCLYNHHHCLENKVQEGCQRCRQQRRYRCRRFSDQL